MSFFALPGIFLSIPGGSWPMFMVPNALEQQLDDCFTWHLAGWVGGSFFLLATGRVIAGNWCLMIAVVAPQAISAVCEQGLGEGHGDYNTAMPLGTIFTLNVFGRPGSILALAEHRFFLVVATACLFCCCFISDIRRYPEKEKQRSHEKPDFKKSVHAIGKIGGPSGW